MKLKIKNQQGSQWNQKLIFLKVNKINKLLDNIRKKIRKKTQTIKIHSEWKVIITDLMET